MGTDLWHLDTETEHYIQAANGNVELRLYDAPAGLPSQHGWQPLDPPLQTATPTGTGTPSSTPPTGTPAASATALGTAVATSLAAAPSHVRTRPRHHSLAAHLVQAPGRPVSHRPRRAAALAGTSPLTATAPLVPANLPFGLTLAPDTGGPSEASLTNEDGVTLGVGLASIDGAAPSAVGGQYAGSAITYTAPVASAPSDLSLRATTSGLDVRLTLHSAAEATAPLVLGLDPRTSLVQEPSGTIRVTQAITSYGDSGLPLVTAQPEYVLGLPLLRDGSTAASAAVQTGPVSMTLASGPGQATVALSLDPAWVQDAGRTFPLQLDLPLVTGFAAVHTGWFGSVSSCTPQ